MHMLSIMLGSFACRFFVVSLVGFCFLLFHRAIHFSAAVQTYRLLRLDRSMASVGVIKKTQRLHSWKKTVVFTCPACHTECLRSCFGHHKADVLSKNITPPQCTKRAIHRCNKSVTMDATSSTLYKHGIERSRFCPSDSSSD